MKKLTYLLFSFFLILMFSGYTSAQTMKKEAVKPFNDGLAKSKKGDYKDALNDFKTALKYDQDYRVYYQIGFAEMKLKNTDGAIKNFENSIKANPKFDGAYNDLGNVYYSLGKYQDAITNFEKVLELSKNEATNKVVKFNLALSYTGLASTAENDKNFKKAISELNKAVGYDNYDVAYLALARNYFQASQYNRAISAGFKALKYKKDIGEGGPNYYIGASYAQKNEVKKAKEYLNKAKADPVYKSYSETILKALQ